MALSKKYFENATGDCPVFAERAAAQREKEKRGDASSYQWESPLAGVLLQDVSDMAIVHLL